jgi:hypothetical protein
MKVVSLEALISTSRLLQEEILCFVVCEFLQSLEITVTLTFHSFVALILVCCTVCIDNFVDVKNLTIDN